MLLYVSEKAGEGEEDGINVSTQHAYGGGGAQNADAPATWLGDRPATVREAEHEAVAMLGGASLINFLSWPVIIAIASTDRTIDSIIKWREKYFLVICSRL